MTKRLAVSVHGVVQGVGFRPFVYRAARERDLVGWVCNGNGGVLIEVQGEDAALDDFLDTLRQASPEEAVVERIDVVEVQGRREELFRIRESNDGECPQPCLPADLSTCPQCLEEVHARSMRRYRYPFTNCTNCGPRYSIVEHMPYDRPNTSMRAFEMCEACALEYRDPADRRFHAQPIACPRCGPRLRLLTPQGEILSRDDEALEHAVRCVDDGRVVALRGLGGFQLLADATNDAAVTTLRIRKHRPSKPFAVMFPSLQVVRQICEVGAEEARALVSASSPILLLARKRTPPLAPPQTSGHPDGPLDIAKAVAPANPRLGVMLPYTPLHHLLLEAIGRPIVCTSGNLSDEPMCIDTGEALARLGDIADVYLTHDRPVVRPVDDSVARFDGGELRVLRRARGYAPRPFRLRQDGPTTLALGGHRKSTVALRIGTQVITSQHLGDLGSAEGAGLLRRAAGDLVGFFAARPQLVACDLHPDYTSTRHAEELARAWDVPLVRVQHHHAHIASCMVEHGLDGQVLGLAWDGTGHGPDGTVWGGEALVCSASGYRRVAHLRHFALPGGERAVEEPRRAALGLLYQLRGDAVREAARKWFADAEIEPLLTMLQRPSHAPITSSMGRLFDAVAALLDLCTRSEFEAQAAMQLEFAVHGIEEETAYPLPLCKGVPAVADWGPLVEALLADRDRGVPVPVLSARFHNALADLAVRIARRADRRRVVLSGGCFQNASLQARVLERLREAGFEVFAHRQIPPNDGGISVGQVLVAGARRELCGAQRKENVDVSGDPR